MAKKEKEAKEVKDAKEEKEPVKEISLQELILNTPAEKYKLIPYAMRWIRELEKKEEHKDLSRSQILDLALKDILSGSVSMEELEKLMAIPLPKKQSEEKNERRKKY